MKLAEFSPDCPSLYSLPTGRPNGKKSHDRRI
ncbi:unnamed protein product, partial [Allacma fusca]